MLLRNQSQEGLVNGSLGNVIKFITVREAQEHHVSVAEMNKGDAERLISSHSGHEFKRDDTFPLVRFTNHKELLCAPTDFTVENLKGGVEACRIQVPLALSYAMSIHKSQGQTLSRVKVDLSSVFEKGQGMHTVAVRDSTLSTFPSVCCSIESNLYGRSPGSKF
ncbi:hypothetical protein SCLCIDRAFT_392200 [Scleroderma citrinum Foug A]|uniref:ATP-dependent DNA helicase n=1 Tax=Scleroderma citrinum Foug A TaxID=1036808 RepID=A0A0C3DDT9_9AGAM|nr:hypothetical protein SCLCIDRAFT_392200 [Scleroderma citrinum Foug A]